LAAEYRNELGDCYESCWFRARMKIYRNTRLYITRRAGTIGCNKQSVTVA